MEVKNDGVLTEEDWEEMWDTEVNPEFHNSEVHRLLDIHFGQLTKGAKNLNILVPLCGKSLDMKWLYDLGHTVVGVELVSAPVKAFFEEQKIEFNTEITANGMTLYKSCDGNIKIYVGDVFQLSRELVGVFDVIWDRGSLGALNVEDQNKYISLEKTLLSSGGCIILATMDYDIALFKGPPHAMPEELIKALYGSDYQVKYVDCLDMLASASPAWGLDWFVEKMYLIVKETKQD